MPDYLPLFAPGTAFTSRASDPITGGQLVQVSGSGVIAPTTAATVSWLGVAASDTAPGDPVTVYRQGIQRLTTATTVVAGQSVEAASNGRVTPHANGTNDAVIVGLALTSAAAGALVEVSLLR